MKRLLLLIFLTVPLLATGQVVNYAKTLPQRAFSVGLVPAYYFDNGSVGLRSLDVEQDENGSFSVALTGGYGIQYSLDLGVKYVYVLNGTDYFGVDLQYLAYEARNAYFSVIAGLHRWDGFGVDLTGLFTYAPKYFLNLSAGLDLDVDYYTDYNETGDSRVGTRFWLPVNVGINAGEILFIYAEYDLPVSQYSWGIAALGVNIVIR
jgi:hypothetical protein